jgi:hypothetical protein
MRFEDLIAMPDETIRPRKRVGKPQDPDPRPPDINHGVNVDPILDQPLPIHLDDPAGPMLQVVPQC